VKDIFLVDTEKDKLGSPMRSRWIRELHDRNDKKYWLVRMDPPQGFYDIRSGTMRNYEFVAITSRFKGHDLTFESKSFLLVNIVSFSAPESEAIFSFEKETFRILGIALAFGSEEMAGAYIANPLRAHMN